MIGVQFMSVRYQRFSVIYLSSESNLLKVASISYSVPNLKAA